MSLWDLEYRKYTVFCTFLLRSLTYWAEIFHITSTVDFGWFVAFGEHQNFPCLKLIEIVILWVFYTIPFGFNLFSHLLVITFLLFKLHCLAKDHWRGFSTRNAHMVHIVNLIRLKWCIHLSRSLYLNLFSGCMYYSTIAFHMKEI